MRKCRGKGSFTLGLLLCAALPGVAGAQATGSPAAPSPTRFQAQIDAFLRADSLAAPPSAGILFVGSSIFRQWADLAEHMRPLPVFNRAFGGSRTQDQLFYMDRIVLPYRPRIVVYYCGSNDVDAGAFSAEIVGRIIEFHDRLRRELPETRMLFASVLRAPQKRNRWPVVDSVNARIREYAATAPNFMYVDINPMLLDARGEVRGEYYQRDSLHYRLEAYPLFASVLRPVVEGLWSTMQDDRGR